MTPEVLVIGGGPAGIAAAIAAAESGKQVIVIDDNPGLGGQIWRGGPEYNPERQARQSFERFSKLGIPILNDAQLISGNAKARTILAETPRGAMNLRFESLILTTGARELFLPFPGWTLPGVMGLGGIQAMAKSGMPVAGKSIVLAGTGPLLLAVASYFRNHGASVKVIAEQASQLDVNHFAAGLWRYPAKVLQAGALRASLFGVPYRFDCWVELAEGQGRLERVRLRQGDKIWEQRCDYAGIAYGLVPNVEAAALFGCTICRDAVHVDELQRTSVEGIFGAGECTGIGGVDAALIQGRIAGYAASGRLDRARSLFARRNASRHFAAALNRAFELRSELKRLPQPDTIVCRCEDVTYEKLQSVSSFRAAKLHTRCGMGPCQARICGAATDFLFGWKTDSIRPPIFPARIDSLVLDSTTLEETVTT